MHSSRSAFRDFKSQQGKYDDDDVKIYILTYFMRACCSLPALRISCTYTFCCFANIVGTAFTVDHADASCAVLGEWA